ncbi:ABC transporter permease [Arthrobacter gallicola]|uniref:ABC transporter permease n=1 Tax=Arthrobacter gallicola TaxID=2762225 RepID=UPI001CD90187|nr:proline/glycine betaine ABC transporter permease [Arthrobacter gallicola]
MNGFRIPLGDWIEVGLDWVTEVFAPVFNAIRTVFRGAYDGLEWLFQAPPFWAVLIILAALAWFLRGWKLGVGTAAGFVLIYGVDQWEHAMETLALVLVASAVAILIGIPLGIVAARSRTASRVIRPVLDFMQTMPAMVYLVPALIIFRVGVVPGIVATIIFAMAPGVRLTELGIRGVDAEVVEAGAAFGSTPGRILRQIQLPLALPTIMAGVNQVIMLSLSMVVIAGMVGAGGLGQDVVASLTRLDPALGFEAGIAVVIVAVYLDRLTSSVGSRAKKRVPAGVSAS